MTKMQSRLVNEKTLELNITHEGMSNSGIGVFGFTQQEESRIGADVLFPYAKPFILQYKAAKSGVDGRWARFRVNNNKRKNQHQALNALARSGLCDAYYAFPLVLSDSFLTSNFGNLINLTCMIEASRLTGHLNWINKAHSVTVRRDCSFTVKSEEVKVKGFPAMQFFDRIRKERDEKPNEKTNLSEFVKDLIKRLDKTVQESRVYGRSEHTVIMIVINIVTMQLGYLQLPVRIRGLQKDFEKQSFRF